MNSARPHAARGFLRLRQCRAVARLRGEEQRFHRLLGRYYAWPDRLGLSAINRRMSPGPPQRPPKRRAGAFGEFLIETFEARARRRASRSRQRATQASTRTGTRTLKRMELAMTSGISPTQASTQRWGMALSRWCSVDKPLVLTFPANGGRGCMRPGSLPRSQRRGR